MAFRKDIPSTNGDLIIISCNDNKPILSIGNTGNLHHCDLYDEKCMYKYYFCSRLTTQ